MNITAEKLRELARYLDDMGDDLGETPEVCEIHLETNGATGKVDAVMLIDAYDNDSGQNEITERKVSL